MKRTSTLTVALLIFIGTGIIARAQIPAPPPAPESQLRSGAELDQMLGPIALYPDPLIAQILPAATQPSEIAVVDRYLSIGGDPNVIDQQLWDPSVKALARYPTVLKWMDDNLAWTTALGQAFLAQPQDVMDSIQRLRAQAQALGNLQSTPQENVIADNGDIEILPANPEMIYVPVYQPDMVYFQRPFGSPFISFGVGFSVGLWLNHDFDWHNHHLIVCGHNQPRPAGWWSRRPSERPRGELSRAAVWQPRSRPVLASKSFDRGYSAPQVHSTVTVIGGQPRPAERHEAPAPAPRPAERREAPAPARPASGAFIGVQSAHQTQQFSTRGQESRQTTISRPAEPAARSTEPAHSEAPSRPANTGRR